MRYLDPQEVLVLHAIVIDETGGRHGVRDIGMLQSSCGRPAITVGGKEAFPTVLEKAAVYMESFARFHVFIDGNKRTAITAAARFLSLNGFTLVVRQRTLVAFALRVVEKRLSVSEIARWLERHAVASGKGKR